MHEHHAGGQTSSGGFVMSAGVTVHPVSLVVLSATVILHWMTAASIAFEFTGALPGGLGQSDGFGEQAARASFNRAFNGRVIDNDFGMPAASIGASRRYESRAAIEIDGLELLAIYRPFTNGFRISAGLFNRKPPSDEWQTLIPQQTFYPGPLSSHAGYAGPEEEGAGSRPYFGVGFDARLFSSRLSLGLDLGIAYDDRLAGQSAGNNAGQNPPWNPLEMKLNTTDWSERVLPIAKFRLKYRF